MRSHLAKVTSKNQLTIPAWAMEELGWPTHFRLAVVQGNLVMFSAGLATFDDQAKEAGIPPGVLREARALVERRKREKAAAGPGHVPVSANPSVPATATGD